jgi:hypothetical protein
MSHDDFDFEPIRGLPAELPHGENLLWQGMPEWKSLAVRAYHVRKVAAYFGLLVAWRIGFGLVNGHTTSAIAGSCGVLLTLGAIAIGVLSLLAYLNARSTVYSITSERVILRHGVAVPLTMNIPFRLIDCADLKTHGDKTSDISLALPASERIGYLITWPHVRAGKITRPQPSLKSLADGQKAAEFLGAALAATAGSPGIRTALADAPVGGGRPRTSGPHPVGALTAGPRDAATA